MVLNAKKSEIINYPYTCGSGYINLCNLSKICITCQSHTSLVNLLFFVTCVHCCHVFLQSLYLPYVWVTSLWYIWKSCVFMYTSRFSDSSLYPVKLTNNHASNFFKGWHIMIIFDNIYIKVKYICIVHVLWLVTATSRYRCIFLV